MKFQSNIFADARGKLNGNVFSKNRYASIVRNKVSPVNPQTSAQQIQRGNFGALSSSFRSLTLEQIEAWNALGENAPKTNVFGQSFKPTGINYYVGLNQNLLNAGQSTIVSPVPFEEMPVIDVETATLVGSSMNQNISLTGIAIDGTDTVPTGYTLIQRATPNVSPSRSYLKNQFRIIGTVASTVQLPTTIATEYTNVFGTITLGQKIVMSFQLVNNATGQSSIPYSLAGIVV